MIISRAILTPKYLFCQDPILAPKNVNQYPALMGRRLTRDVLKEAARVFGREGGKARAKQLSPERRSEIARKAVQARWQKANKKKPG